MKGLTVAQGPAAEARQLARRLGLEWAPDEAKERMYRAVMADAGASVRVTATGWVATSPNAPWGQQ
jgi:hypothetical protein